MAEVLHIKSPLDEAMVMQLKAGDAVLISGIVYTARDAAHKRLIAALDKGEELPFDPKRQTIYYVGPSPAPPGRAVGSAGPTTSYRMDSFAPRLMAVGLRAMIGKGSRSQSVKDAIKKYKAVYLAATGGAGALIGKCIKKAEPVAYADLGPEAIIRLEVEDLPAIVVNDIHGGDAYLEGKARYERAST